MQCSVGVENGAGRETDSAIGLGIGCAALVLGWTNPIETSFEMEVGRGRRTRRLLCHSRETVTE